MIYMWLPNNMGIFPASLYTVVFHILFIIMDYFENFWEKTCLKFTFDIKLSSLLYKTAIVIFCNISQTHTH